MARLPAIPKEQIAEEHQDIYDEISATLGRLPAVMEMLMYRPVVAGMTERLGRQLRFDTEALPRSTIELVTLTVAREWDCLREWSVHVGQARRAGVSDETIEAVRQRRAPEGLSKDEALLVTYTQEIMRMHRVSDETFQAVLEQVGNVGIVVLTALAGYYTMIATTLNAFEVQPSPPTEEMTQLPL